MKQDSEDIAIAAVRRIQNVLLAHQHNSEGDWMKPRQGVSVPEQAFPIVDNHQACHAL